MRVHDVDPLALPGLAGQTAKQTLRALQRGRASGSGPGPAQARAGLFGVEHVTEVESRATSHGRRHRRHAVSTLAAFAAESRLSPLAVRDSLRVVGGLTEIVIISPMSLLVRRLGPRGDLEVQVTLLPGGGIVLAYRP
jgi:hypothetical protein